MGEFLSNALEQLLGRMSGPFHARFLFQPLMASILAIRAGLNDAKTNRSPYLWAIFSKTGQWRALVREGWKDVAKVFVVAFLLDSIYEVAVLQWFYPGQALIVAFALAVVPYVIIRGPTARIVCRWRLTRHHNLAGKA